MRYRDIDAVKRLIKNRIPESTSLEYKSDLLLTSIAARKELLKDLTGMGNGGGGTVIFGMEEEPGTNVAKEPSPLPDATTAGRVEDIVRDAVHPPLIWSYILFEADPGWVIVADVEPSTLGPYMVDAYNENRYHKRTGQKVHPMSEQEVRDAYAIALRATEQRALLWEKHSLPIGVPPNEPWLVVSALPQEPLREIFDARQINLMQFVRPSPLARYIGHTGLTFATQALGHWRDGLAGDDGVNGVEPGCVLRLYRDGAVGVAGRWPQQDLQVGWVARVLNAYLVYLAWFWDEFSLARPVELKLAIGGLSKATVSAHNFSLAQPTIVQPVGVAVNEVIVSEEVLPWELLRAPVRHRLLRRLCDQLEQAFGSSHVSELFERGWLYDRHGSNTQLVLRRGGIAEVRQGGHGLASLDSAGRVYGASSAGEAYVVDGVLIDEHGDTVALVEMAPGIGCPDEFLPDITSNDRPPAPNWNRDPIPTPAGTVAPLPIGKWSELAARDILR